MSYYTNKVISYFPLTALGPPFLLQCIQSDYRQQNLAHSHGSAQMVFYSLPPTPTPQKIIFIFFFNIKVIQ